MSIFNTGTQYVNYENQRPTFIAFAFIYRAIYSLYHVSTRLIGHWFMIQWSSPSSESWVDPVYWVAWGQRAVYLHCACPFPLQLLSLLSGPFRFALCCRMVVVVVLSLPLSPAKEWVKIWPRRVLWEVFWASQAKSKSPEKVGPVSPTR